MNPYRMNWKPQDSTPMDSMKRWSKHYLLLTLLAILLIGLTFSFGGMMGEEAAQRRIRPLMRNDLPACTDELHPVSTVTSVKCGSPEQSGSLEVREGRVFLQCRCGRLAVFSCGPMVPVDGSCSIASRDPSM